VGRAASVRSFLVRDRLEGLTRIEGLRLSSVQLLFDEEGDPRGLAARR